MNRPSLRIDLDKRDEVTGLTVAELCYTDLASFWQFFWPIVTGGDVMTPGWHYDYTADRVMLALERGYGTLGIVWPFGTGKSTALSKLTHPWDWMHRPHNRWLGIGASNSIYRDGHRSRQLVLSPEYQALCARAGITIDLAPDQNEKKDYLNTVGGQRHSYRVGDSVIGVDADVLLVDDAINPKKVDRGSPMQIAGWLENARDKWRKDWIDRLRRRPTSCPDYLPGVRMLINQRTAIGDLTDMLIELRDSGRDDVELICIPEEYDPDIPGGACPADPRTEPGELLNPNFRSAAQMAAYRAESGERFVATRLNGRPTAQTGGMFRKAFYEHRYSDHPHAMAKACSSHVLVLDCGAEKGDSNDPTCAWLIGKQGAYKYVLWEWRGRLDITEQPGWMQDIGRELHEVWGFKPAQVQSVERGTGGQRAIILVGNLQWYVENASNGAALLKMRPVPKMLSFSPHGNSKAGRAVDFSHSSKAGEWRFPLDQYAPWARGAIEEISGFGVGSTHDERVDCGAMGQHYFDNHVTTAGHRPYFR